MDLEAWSARLKVLAVRAASEAPLDPGTVEGRDRRVVVGTASDPLELVTVQPAGKPAMAAADWWRGLRVSRLVVGS